MLVSEGLYFLFFIVSEYSFEFFYFYVSPKIVTQLTAHVYSCCDTSAAISFWSARKKWQMQNIWAGIASRGTRLRGWGGRIYAPDGVNDREGTVGVPFVHAPPPLPYPFHLLPLFPLTDWYLHDISHNINTRLSLRNSPSPSFFLRNPAGLPCRSELRGYIIRITLMIRRWDTR